MRYQIKAISIDAPSKEEILVIEATSQDEAFSKAKQQGLQAYEINPHTPKESKNIKTFPLTDLIIILGVMSVLCALIFGVFYLLTLDTSTSSTEEVTSQNQREMAKATSTENESSSDSDTNRQEINTQQAPSELSFLADANQAKEYGNYKEAIKIYVEALKRYPDSESIYLSAGNCFSKLDDPDREISVYQHGVEKISESELLNEALANAFLRNRQYGDAARAYAKAVDLKPNDAGIWFFYGISLMKSGRDSDAENAFLHSSAIEANWANTWYNLGMVCVRQKNYSHAIMHYTRALRIDPSEKEVWEKYNYTLSKYGPHRAYCLAWLDAKNNNDFRSLRKRAQEKVNEITYAVFPQLRSDQDRMWAEMERALIVLQQETPDITQDPLVNLKCALIAAQKLAIRPSFPTTSNSERGSLKIENKTGNDALIKVYNIDQKQVWRHPSILDGQHVSLRNIPDGHYLVLFALTDELSAHSGKLGMNARASKFDKSLVFTTSTELKGDTIYEETTTYTISLHKVVGGNAKISGIPIDEFENY